MDSLNFLLTTDLWGAQGLSSGRCPREKKTEASLMIHQGQVHPRPPQGAWTAVHHQLVPGTIRQGAPGPS